MTDRTVLSPSASECRLLTGANVQGAADIVNGVQSLNMEGLKAILDHLDRAKTFAVAWYRAGNPVAEKTAGERLIESARAESEKLREQAEQPKRKGGWPKGRSRKRNNPAEVMQ